MGGSEPRDSARGWRGSRSGVIEIYRSFVGGGVEGVFPVHTPSNYLRAVWINSNIIKIIAVVFFSSRHGIRREVSIE